MCIFKISDVHINIHLKTGAVSDCLTDCQTVVFITRILQKFSLHIDWMVMTGKDGENIIGAPKMQNKSHC